MNSPVRNWRILAAISASTLALAACGGGGGDDEAETDSVAPAASAEASSDTGAAAPKNAADGVLTIGTLLPQTGSLAFLGPH